MVHPRVTAAVKLLKTIKLNWTILDEISCVAPSIISSHLNLLFRLLSQGLMTVMWQGHFIAGVTEQQICSPLKMQKVAYRGESVEADWANGGGPQLTAPGANPFRGFPASAVPTQHCTKDFPAIRGGKKNVVCNIIPICLKGDRQQRAARYVPACCKRRCRSQVNLVLWGLRHE